MSDEKIEVEWIGTANRMMQVIERMDQRMERQEKTLQKLSDTGKKGTDAVAGSFNKLEQELKQNEIALKNMRIGGPEFEKQRQKVEALRASLDKANKTLRGEKIESPWPAIGKGMAVATGAAAGLVAALVKVADAQREIVSQGADQAVNLDTLARKMQIQAGLTDEQRQQESLQVIAQASQAGVTAPVGFQAATQLAGSGFANPVQSGSLQTILNTIQASSFQGSPEELVSAFAEALNAYGLEKTNQNLQQIAVSAQSLFKQTDFQLTELQDFAKNASVFEGANIKIDEALAGFTALREVLPAAESGTGLRNFVNKLQAGDLTKENKDNLQRIGVNAGQVDFVGESLTQVLQTVKTATDKMPEADRNAALGKMFGTENVASARLLINSVNRIQELQKSQQNAQQFNTDLATASGGMQAERNRIENQRLLDVMPNAEALNKLDLIEKRREIADKAAVENATLKFGGAVGVGVQATASVLRSGDTVLGEQGGTRRGVESALTFGMTDFLRFFQSSEQRQQEQIALQREANALLQAQRPQQRQPVPQVRPQVAPLPAATAP
jgi:hypothetical protein